MTHGLWKMFRFNTHALLCVDGLLGVLRRSSLHLRYMHTMPSQSGNGLERLNHRRLGLREHPLQAMPRPLSSAKVYNRQLFAQV